jgi:UDP-N-acetylglucosamine diphosphorylase / glucose-1-phosphate thymidylyltransferase / UDP-N-acetylgalactosamine diphosphorylase / glucosamine-1-phosphate N-acetyltransferase / galactosamine-1-phosphate N-acetyltransferase
MTLPICIFEGENYTNLLPLVYTRPVYDLRCGILTLKEKIIRLFPDTEISLHVRDYLKDMVIRDNPGMPVNEIKGNSCLFINGRVLCDDKFVEQITHDTADTLYVKGGSIIAAKVSGLNLKNFEKSIDSVFKISDFGGLIKKEIDANIVNFPWELVKQNGDEIRKDFITLTKDEKNKIKGKVYEGVFMVNKDNIFIDEGAVIKPGVVLDAEEGPIYIGKDAKIFPQATLEGPVFVGNKSAIKIGAKIYENTSIGEVCKVGGEVEGSIIHSHSNKQHDGFLGHAYLGQWVNLGADTNNSDLKNNYGSVKVYINDKLIDSGSMFVGLTMGDHSKSSINTMFNTGTVVGISTNIFGTGFPAKYVPSFIWGGSEQSTTYEIEKAIDVAKRVMARRKIPFTEIEQKIFETVFELTRDERKRRGLPA